MTTQTWVVLPAYNEQEALPRLLAKMVPLYTEGKLHGRIIVVDDGSRDQTAEIARMWRPPVELVSHPRNLGLGAAIRTGLSYAVAHAADADAIVTLDADDTHSPGLILCMVQKLSDGLCAVKRPRQRLIFCIVMIATFTAADLNYYAGREFQNPIYIIPSKEIAHQIWTQASPQDVVLASRDSVLKRYYPEHHAQVFDESDLNALRSYLEITPVAQLWLVDVNRDRGGDIWPPEWSAWLQAHYQPVEKWGYAQMSPGYRRFKTWLTHRQAYQYKAELTLYRRRE